MKWLEIIELRSASSTWKSMEAEVQSMVLDMNKETSTHSLTAYSRAMIDNDFSIHLIHDSCSVEKNGSSLGFHLVSLLKEFGLVNHSVWIEL